MWGKLTSDEIAGEMAPQVDTLGQAAAQAPTALVKEMLSQLLTFSVAVILSSFEPFSKDTNVLLPRHFEGYVTKFAPSS